MADKKKPEKGKWIPPWAKKEEMKKGEDSKKKPSPKKKMPMKKSDKKC